MTFVNKGDRMILEKAKVHYLTKDGNPIIRNKNVLTTSYNGYEIYVLDEDKYDFPYVLYKDRKGEYWMFYNASISYNRLEELSNPEITEYDKNCISQHFDYVISKVREVFDDYSKYAEDKIKIDGYFNKIELAYLEIYYPNLHSKALASRENNLLKKQEELEQEKLQKESNNKRKIAECNSKINEKIELMKENISQGNLVLSENLEYYRNDNIYDKVIQNNFLYLAKEYGINIPLATQGFINNKLYSYNFGTGEIRSYGGYKGSTLYKYLDLIKEKVKNEFESKENIQDQDYEYEIE